MTSVMFPVSLPAIKFDPWISTLAYRLHVENPKLGIEQILLLNISPEIKTLGWRFLRIWFDPITRNLQRMYLNCNILENFRVLDSWNNYIKLKTSGRRNLKNLTKILKDGSNGPNTIQQFSNVLLYGLFHKCIAKILPSAIPVKRTVCKSGTLRFRP